MMQHPTSNLVAGPGTSVTDSMQQQNWTRPKNEATYMTVCGDPEPTWLKCFSLPHIDINPQNHPPRRDITLSLLYNPLPKILIIMLCIVVVISWSFVHYGLLICMLNTSKTHDYVPYSGKIWRAINLAKWRKKVVFWYWRNLNLAIWNCTCDVIVARGVR